LRNRSVLGAGSFSFLKDDRSADARGQIRVSDDRDPGLECEGVGVRAGSEIDHVAFGHARIDDGGVRGGKCQEWSGEGAIAGTVVTSLVGVDDLRGTRTQVTRGACGTCRPRRSSRSRETPWSCGTCRSGPRRSCRTGGPCRSGETPWSCGSCWTLMSVLSVFSSLAAFSSFSSLGTRGGPFAAAWNTGV
jgi:hypothetical protein